MDPYIQYMYSYPHKTAYGSLEGVRFEDYAGRLVGGENSLYFHIPFCRSRCGYCNLFSVAGQGTELMERYVDAMERQAAQVAEAVPAGVRFADLTLGGGTPLRLPERQLERVFEIAEEQLGFVGGRTRDGERVPVIVETSPGETTAEKLDILKRHHVTRISMGVQSFDEKELKSLCRNHSVEQVEQALDLIAGEGFPCVNLDLIYGIPGQTMESFMASVRRAMAYGPEELFIYPLYIRKGTYLYQRGAVRPENTYEMYVQIREFLRENGYRPYSMRRFVREDVGRAATSCGFGNTVSIGCGGRSYLGNLHFCSPYAIGQAGCLDILKEYIDREDHLAIRHGYLLTAEEERRRYVIKNVLFDCGIGLAEYREVYGSEAGEDFPVLEEWIRKGYACKRSGRICLTEKGFSLSDRLGPMLLPEKRAAGSGASGAS